MELMDSHSSFFMALWFSVMKKMNMNLKYIKA